MVPGSTLHANNLWAEDPERAKAAKAKAEKTRRPKRLHGKRRHRFRRHKPGLRASGRVSDRLRRGRRSQALLRAFSVPVLALVPACVYLLEYPLNLVIAPALGVMGLVLMFGSK